MHKVLHTHAIRAALHDKGRDQKNLSKRLSCYQISDTSFFDQHLIALFAENEAAIVPVMWDPP